MSVRAFGCARVSYQMFNFLLFHLSNRTQPHRLEK